MCELSVNYQPLENGKNCNMTKTVKTCFPGGESEAKGWRNYLRGKGRTLAAIGSCGEDGLPCVVCEVCVKRWIMPGCEVCGSCRPVVDEAWTEEGGIDRYFAICWLCASAASVGGVVPAGERAGETYKRISSEYQLYKHYPQL